MKSVILHVGMGKTGSSSLQSWLSKNAAKLLKQNYFYADLAPEARHGKTTSGNGYPLWLALRADDYEKVERLILQSYFREGVDRAIISCEQLQYLSRKRIQLLKDIFTRNGISVTVLVYVRSVY